MFRQFRDTFLRQNNPELIEEYYSIAPQIVANIEEDISKDNIYKELWESKLSKCLHYIERGETTEAKECYQSMVIELKLKFLK